MGMHFTGKSSVVCEANITAEWCRSSACVRQGTFYQWKQAAIYWWSPEQQKVSSAFIKQVR